MNITLKLFVYLLLISVFFSVESNGDEIVITGTSQDGTTSSDDFVVESGLDLSIDALSGIDYFNAGITGGGDVSLSYNSGIDTFTIGGDSLNITGSFTSFEDITLTFDDDAYDVVMSGRDWRALFLDGGGGIDKITTPATGVTSGSVFVSGQDDGRLKIILANGHLADFTISNFEVLSTTNGKSNLYMGSDIVSRFQEVMGGESSGLDTLHIQYSAETVFIWDEEEEWYFAVLGSTEATKISHFEWLNIQADTIYTENKELFTTTFNGQTLYGVDTIQFYSNTTDIRAIDNLNRETFSTIDSDSDGVIDALDIFPLNALYKADSDSDGMPDAWETRYGLDPNDASDAASDRDNDGVTALDEFLAGTIPSGSLDIDGNENYDALTDGLLLLRGMFGLDGSALVTGTIAPDAAYTDSVDIESRIATLGDLADIDGNGEIDALTDGLLTLRYLFGLQGDTLINGVVAGDATRKTAEEIEAHLETLMPSL
jgi:hypothetical protein